MSASIEAPDLILARCRALGFVRAGIAEAGPSEYADKLRAWLDHGKHGEMSYMARKTALRIDPRAMVPGARSIICVADRYWVETSKRPNVEASKEEEWKPGLRSAATKARVGRAGAAAATNHPQAPPPRPSPSEGEGAVIGRIARYARGDDYHKVMKKRLQALCDELRAMFPDHTFRACVDTAPVLEREFAQRAGIGAVGKHTLIIERGVGSYLFLGQIITTLPLAPSPPAAPDPCGTCTRCIDACPTNAITPWSVDATKCISYLTIEHRSEIDPKYHAAMGDWIFGCDICQEVCPHNQPTERSQRAAVHPAYEPRREGFDLLQVLRWTEEGRRAAMRGTALKRAKLDMIKRNALIAAGNTLRRRDDAGLLAGIEALARDDRESSLVRHTAREILSAHQSSTGESVKVDAASPARNGAGSPRTHAP